MPYDVVAGAAICTAGVENSPPAQHYDPEKPLLSLAHPPQRLAHALHLNPPMTSHDLLGLFDLERGRKVWFLSLRSVLLLAASALLVGTAETPVPTMQAFLIVLLLASVAPLAALPAQQLFGPLMLVVATIDVAWIAWALHASGTFAASTILPGILVAALVVYGRTIHGSRRSQEPVATAAEHEAEDRIRAAIAATRDLERRHEALLEENRTKNEFVANMSHELRTPLNIITGYTDMLRDENSSLGPAESDRLMARIRTAASNLLHLVDMVLDLGKLEAGKIPVQSTSLALDTFVEEVAARERIPLARGVTLHCQAEPGLPVIETDRSKLTMVLDNLVSNAIKFTQEGSIAVRVTHDREGCRVQFEVEDTGPGIEPQHLETIFEPFHQLERSSDNPFGGVGLGLAIVHRYVELLGGTITVRSTVDVGTCFKLALPYRPGAERSENTTTATHEAPSGTYEPSSQLETH